MLGPGRGQARDFVFGVEALAQVGDAGVDLHSK